MQQSSWQIKTLTISNFSDKPRFVEETQTFSVVEGGHLLINLVATANPPEVEYKWFKSGTRIPEESEALHDSRVVALIGDALGTLNISLARREDAGMYKVKAKNSEGETKLKFKLDVHYAPT